MSRARQPAAQGAPRSSVALSRADRSVPHSRVAAWRDDRGVPRSTGLDARGAAAGPFRRRCGLRAGRAGRRAGRRGAGAGRRPFRGVVHRTRAGGGHRLRALQRHVRRVPPRRDHGAGRRAVRHGRRRRPRRLPRPGPDARGRTDARRRPDAASGPCPAAPDRPPLPQRPADRGGRHADAAVHRRDRGERPRRELLRDGSRGRRLRRRRPGRPLPHRAGREPVVPQRRRRHVQRCCGACRRRRRGLGRVGFVLRLRPGRPARPVRRQLRRLRPRERGALFHPHRRAGLLRAEELCAGPGSAVPQPRRRRLRGRDGERGRRPRVRTGPRRAGRRFRR